MTETDPQTLQALRRAFRARPLSDEPLVSPPSADALWAVAAGEASEEEALEVADAVARSPEVALQWRATVAMVEAASAKAEATPVEVTPEAVPRSPRWGWALAVAAAVVLALALRPPRPPIEEEATSGPLRAPPTTTLVPVPAVGVRVRAPLVLQWSGHAEGSRFDVVVQDEQLDTIAEGLGLATPTFTVPSSALARRRGTRVFWRVTVLGEDGQRRVSPTYWVDVIEP